MTLRTLRDPRPKPVPQQQLPRCESPLTSILTPHMAEWREQRYGKRSKLCRRISAYEIDGKQYCRMHAGEIALDMWSRGELAEREK